MSNIKEGLKFINEPDKSIGLTIISFYEDMKKLEKDEYKGSKQAVAIIMCINDLKSILIDKKK